MYAMMQVRRKIENLVQILGYQTGAVTQTGRKFRSAGSSSWPEVPAAAHRKFRSCAASGNSVESERNCKPLSNRCYTQGVLA